MMDEINPEISTERAVMLYGFDPATIGLKYVRAGTVVRVFEGRDTCEDGDSEFWDAPNLPPSHIASIGDLEVVTDDGDYDYIDFVATSKVNYVGYWDDSDYDCRGRRHYYFKPLR